MVQPVGPLVDDLHPEVVEERQHLRQPERLAAVQLEPGLPRRGPDRGVQQQVQVRSRAAAGLHGLQAREVPDGNVGGHVLLVRLGQRTDPAPAHPDGLALAELRGQAVGEVLLPGPGRRDQALLDGGQVHVGSGAARGEPDDEVQPGQHRLRHPGRVPHRRAPEGLHQHVLNDQADRGGVAVAGQVDQARHVAPEGVVADEEPGAAPLLQLQHPQADPGERLHVGGEQLVARVGLQDAQQVLAGVAAGAEAAGREHRGHLAVDHGHRGDALGVRRGAEQAEEAPLPHHLTGPVVDLDAHVVQVGGAVHGGAAVGLGEHEHVVAPGVRGDVCAEVVGPGGAAVVAHDAQPGAGDRLQHRRVRGRPRTQGVLPVAEEREVLVGQPAQEPCRLCGVGGVERPEGQPRRQRVEVVGHRLGRRLHGGPVLDGGADVGQDGLQRAGQGDVGVGGIIPVVRVVALVLGPSRLGRGRSGRSHGCGAVDLDVDPGLDPDVVTDRVGVGLAVGDLEHLEQLTVGVAPDDDLRVHHQVDAPSRRGQLVDDRVHQEGHVVGDDLDDGVRGGPAVLGDARGEHAHERTARFAQPGEGAVGQHPGADVRGVATEQVHVGDVREVPLHQQPVPRGAAPFARQGRSPSEQRCPLVLHPSTVVPSGYRRRSRAPVLTCGRACSRFGAWT